MRGLCTAFYNKYTKDDAAMGTVTDASQEALLNALNML